MVCVSSLCDVKHPDAAGEVVGELLEQVIPIMAANLDPEKDPEVRLKFFTLLSRLVLNAPRTLDSQHRLTSYSVV